MSAKLLRLILMLLALGPGKGFATTFLELDSSYVGDGWFQYRMQLMKDPFFSEAYVTELVVNFTNQVDCQTSPQDWTNTVWGNTQSDWFPSQDPPERPYENTFLMRSSETSYRLATNSFDGAAVLMSLYPVEWLFPYPSGIVSANLVGYACVPCLVPCGPDEADGSPATFSYALKLLPDVAIQRLIQTNGVVQGLDFTWGYASTFLLQASMEATTWTNVCYLWSSPPETVWTTNLPLNSFGQFFRLELVANGYLTNPPPLNANVLAASQAAVKGNVAAAAPRVSGCQAARGRIAVSISAEPNQACTVNAVDNHNVVRATQQVTVSSNSATVYFDAASLPTPVYFQAAAASSLH